MFSSCVGFVEFAFGLLILLWVCRSQNQTFVVDHALRCKSCFVFADHAVGFVDLVLDLYI